MRKNAPRKWIHAILDLLPLFVIPIFAININQKEVEPIRITVGGDYVVQNKYQTNAVNSFDDLVIGNIYDVDSLRLSPGGDGYNFTLYLFKCESFDYENWGDETTDEIYIDSYDSNEYNYITFDFDDDNLQVYATISNDYGYVNIDFTNGGIELLNATILLPNNESLNGFKYFYTEYEYLYENIHESSWNQLEYVYVDEIVYDETDIGSQFLYSIYKPVNDYFNFNNLFNMNDVWNWIQLNLFSGSAPLPVFIVWNIILYEFFIDLIFLLYSVFMFIIDFATNCLERPFNKVR